MNSTLESILIMIEDTTETEKLWERTTMADRISSLSLLSAGMAHEVNNPLAAVKSHVDFLMAIEDDESKRESIGWIDNGIKRISAIVDKVTQYMQGSEEEITENINLIIEETCELLQTRIKHQGVRVILNQGHDIPELKISPDLFKQLLLNLVLNAVDACSEGDVITITTQYSEPEGILRLYVEDTGKGIPPHHLSKVFNPFYSYGKAGKGSGLGLSVCYGIVDRAGGNIMIESEENRGTVVEVSFYENEYSYSG
jgi:signal transduction histidine kinase